MYLDSCELLYDDGSGHGGAVREQEKDLTVKQDVIN